MISRTVIVSSGSAVQLIKCKDLVRLSFAWPMIKH